MARKVRKTAANHKARKIPKTATNHQTESASGLQSVPSSPITKTKPGGAVYSSDPPDLQSSLRETSRIDFKNLARIIRYPMKTLESLYYSASLQSALLLLVVSGIVVWLLGSLVAHGTLAHRAVYFVGGISKFFASFVIIGLVATAISRIFYGRGNAVASMTLLGYCAPWEASMSALMLGAYIVYGNTSGTLAWLGIGMAIVAIIVVAWLIFVVMPTAVMVANRLSSNGTTLAFAAGWVAYFGFSRLIALSVSAAFGIGLDLSFIPVGNWSL